MQIAECSIGALFHLSRQDRQLSQSISFVPMKCDATRKPGVNGVAPKYLKQQLFSILFGGEQLELRNNELNHENTAN